MANEERSAQESEQSPSEGKAERRGVPLRRRDFVAGAIGAMLGAGAYKLSETVSGPPSWKRSFDKAQEAFDSFVAGKRTPTEVYRTVRLAQNAIQEEAWSNRNRDPELHSVQNNYFHRLARMREQLQQATALTTGGSRDIDPIDREVEATDDRRVESEILSRHAVDLENRNFRSILRRLRESTSLTPFERYLQSELAWRGREFMTAIGAIDQPAEHYEYKEHMEQMQQRMYKTLSPEELRLVPVFQGYVRRHFARKYPHQHGFTSDEALREARAEDAAWRREFEDWAKTHP
jgi:hypothetical protein